MGHDREKACIAIVALLCSLYQEQSNKGRWYVHEKKGADAWKDLCAIAGLRR